MEFLVKLRTTKGLDPALPGVWELGEPVVAMPDGHEWGKLERPPAFLVVKVPDMTAAEAEVLLEHDYDLDGATGEETGHTQNARRRWRADITQAKLDALLPDPLPDSVTVTFNQIRNYLKDRVSGAKVTRSDLTAKKGPRATR